MDQNYVLTGSSIADIPEEQFEEMDVAYNPFYFNLDGVSYKDDLGKTIPYEKFYQMIEEGATPTTSQPNYEDYYNFFKPALEEGKDVIHLVLSSGISGAINSATSAAQDLMEEFPDRKITVIDSLAASSGYGLLLTEAAEKRDEGYSFDELVDWIEDNKLNLHHWFLSTDLTSYKRGGRISPAAATFGTLLNICPLLNVDDKGQLIPRKKVRGKKNTMKKLIDEMKKHAENGTDYDGKCYISHSNSPEDANTMVEMIEENFPNLKGKIQVNPIGTVIGSHTGPGTLAVFFWGDKRED